MKHLPNDLEGCPGAAGDDPFPKGDALWEALGGAGLREPDGWFTARTLARARRAEAGSRQDGWGWLRRMLGPVAVGAAAAVALAVLIAERERGGPAAPAMAMAEVEVMAPPSRTVPEAAAAAPATTPYDEAFEFLAASNTSATEDVWAGTVY